jgi:hypothetical protein
LCRFGFSNKRELHTIGFRGIGFKSIFSIGDEVFLSTPSLSVSFHQNRFTEPVWIPFGDHQSQTTIKIKIRDKFCFQDLNKNLEEWRKNSISLLFFKSIHSLVIRGEEIKWEKESSGPVNNSHWMKQVNNPKHKYLVIHSEPEHLDDAALEEIRQERMVYDDEVEFPPVTIDIVLGIEGRLFVILPTGVKTKLPFACNAPFIQDPARLNIKDPNMSPTNRWLLTKAGRLASEAMLCWLKDETLVETIRCKAYDLLPDVDFSGITIEDACAQIVEEAFHNQINETPFLFTESCSLEPKQRCLSIPKILLTIWPESYVSNFFGNQQPILHQSITKKNRDKLIHYAYVEKVEKNQITDKMASNHLKKPESWEQNLLLWDYVASEINSSFFRKARELFIIPVMGKQILYSPRSVVRLRKKELIPSEEDNEFLLQNLHVMDSAWLLFLEEEKSKQREKDGEGKKTKLNLVDRILREYNLDRATEQEKVLQLVAGKFFNQEHCLSLDSIRLAQIVASLNVAISSNFKFLTRDNKLKAVSQEILADIDGDVREFVPPHWYETHTLHEDYGIFLSCTEEAWRKWVHSHQSKLFTFIPLKNKHIEISGDAKLKATLIQHDSQESFNKPYVTDSYTLLDWDFEDEIWDHWHALSFNNGLIWGQIMSHIFKQNKYFWIDKINLTVKQIATTGSTKKMLFGSVTPTWVIKFRAYCCMLDDSNQYRLPSDVFRRTDKTEFLLNEEPFVYKGFDQEDTVSLLNLLGVKDRPLGAIQFLEKLRKTKNTSPLSVIQVEKDIKCIDLFYRNCLGNEKQIIRTAFHNESLILTERARWAHAKEVFLSTNEEEVPGVPIIYGNIRELPLWTALGVRDRPTLAFAIKWLKSIQPNQKLSPDEVVRVVALQGRYFETVWYDCNCWLNLEDEWTPVSEIQYVDSDFEQAQKDSLNTEIRKQTANCSNLPSSTLTIRPFSLLPSLGSIIEYRVNNVAQKSEIKLNSSWLRSFGGCVKRIQMEEEEREQLTIFGQRIERTKYYCVDEIIAEPYLNGTIAGSTIHRNAFWFEHKLYIKNDKNTNMMKAAVREISRKINQPEICEALKYCYQRDEGFINDYFMNSFDMLPEPEEHSNTQAEPAGISDQAPRLDPEEFSGQTPEPEQSQTQRKKQQSDSNSKSKKSHGSFNPFKDFRAINVNDDAFDKKEYPGDDELPREKRTWTSKTNDHMGVLERFADKRGYEQGGSGNYIHPNGNFFISGKRHLWKEYDKYGELIKLYLVKDNSFEESMSVKSEVWEIFQKYPDKTALILETPQGKIDEIPGGVLSKLHKRDQVKIFPSSYALYLDLTYDLDIASPEQGDSHTSICEEDFRLKEKLLRFDVMVLHRRFPHTALDLKILQPDILKKLISDRPTTYNEMERLISASLWQKVEQKSALDEVFEIIKTDTDLIKMINGDSKWASGIPFRFYLVFSHINKHGSIAESALNKRLGGPRKARRFASDSEQWLDFLPFKFSLTMTKEGKTYIKN